MLLIPAKINTSLSKSTRLQAIEKAKEPHSPPSMAQCVTRCHIHGPERETEGEAGAGEKEALKSRARGPIDAASRWMFPFHARLAKGTCFLFQEDHLSQISGLLKGISSPSLSLSLFGCLYHTLAPLLPPFCLSPSLLFSEHLALHSG